MPSATRVLVVEDDQDLLLSMAETLRDAGYDVVIAIDGHVAIRVLTATRPDAVVLDLNLPFVDGLEVLRWVKDRRCDVPIIVATVQDDKTAEDLGAVAKLSKPFTVEQLTDAVKRATSGRPASEV